MPNPFIWYANYYSIVYNEGGVGILCKYKIFWKFGLKFLKNIFLIISPYFLVEDCKSFHLICVIFWISIIPRVGLLEIERENCESMRYIYSTQRVSNLDSKSSGVHILSSRETRMTLMKFTIFDRQKLELQTQIYWIQASTQETSFLKNIWK